MSYKVKLEVFEGPLDLLLYLIKKDELDITDIPIAKITQEYLEYLELMKLLDLNIAGEFIVMAATLMHIKSRMLLPPEELEELEAEQADPREELVKQLLEYKKFKEAAGHLGVLEQRRKEIFTRFPIDMDWEDDSEEVFFEANLFDLISAFSKVLKEVSKEEFQEIIKDEWTVEQKTHDIIKMLTQKKTILFIHLFDEARNRYEIIATFLALLELIRLKVVLIKQHDTFGEIEITRKGSAISAQSGLRHVSDSE